MKHLLKLVAALLLLLTGCENDEVNPTGAINLPAGFAITPLPNELNNGALANVTVSGNGRFVVLTTTARLVANDQDNFTDVYRLDRQENTWLLLSTNIVSNAFSASISDNGNRVLFTASQSPAVPDRATAIYLWENNTVFAIQEGQQDPFSPLPLIAPLVGFTNIISPNGQQLAVSVDLNHIVAPLNTLQGRVVSNGQPSDFSTDGRFHTWVDVDILNPQQSPRVWLYDAATGNNVPITRGTAYSDSPRISGNGQLVVFESEMGDLTGAEDANGLMDIFVFDQTIPRYTRLTPPNSNGFSHTPDISADGNVIVFSSSSNNLAAPDNDLTFDIYAVINGQMGNLTLNTNQACVNPVLSSDGRFVVFIAGPAGPSGIVSPQNAQVFIAGPLR